MGRPAPCRWVVRPRKGGRRHQTPTQSTSTGGSARREVSPQRDPRLLEGARFCLKKKPSFSVTSVSVLPFVEPSSPISPSLHSSLLWVTVLSHLPFQCAHCQETGIFSVGVLIIIQNQKSLLSFKKFKVFFRFKLVTPQAEIK